MYMIGYRSERVECGSGECGGQGEGLLDCLFAMFLDRDLFYTSPTLVIAFGILGGAISLVAPQTVNTRALIGSSFITSHFFPSSPPCTIVHSHFLQFPQLKQLLMHTMSVDTAKIYYLLCMYDFSYKYIIGV